MYFKSFRHHGLTYDCILSLFQLSEESDVDSEADDAVGGDKSKVYRPPKVAPAYYGKIYFVCSWKNRKHSTLTL